MQWWLEVHIHLLSISNNANPKHWDEVVLPHLEYHSDNLACIRKWSLIHPMLVLQSYIYLQDGHSKGYQDIKLLAALRHPKRNLHAFGHMATCTPKCKRW